MDHLLFCVHLKFSRDASTGIRSRFSSPACCRRSVHVGSCPIWHARWPVRATAARLYSCLLSPCNCQLLPYGTRPAGRCLHSCHCRQRAAGGRSVLWAHVPMCGAPAPGLPRQLSWSCDSFFLFFLFQIRVNGNNCAAVR